MAEHNYKAGDKVRVTNSDWVQGCPIGSTGKISQVLNHGVFVIRDGGDNFPWFFNFKQIEPAQAKIKVGDRVRLHTHTDTRMCGERGSVVDVSGIIALVEMDEPGTWGSKSEWLPLNKLELTDDAPVAEPEPKFKAGDVVGCMLDEKFSDFTKGKTYTVEDDGVDEYGYVCIVADDAGDPNGLQPEYFQLVTPQDSAEPTPKFKAGDVVGYRPGSVMGDQKFTIKAVGAKYNKRNEVAYTFTNDLWDHESELVLVSTTPCIVARVKDGKPFPSLCPHVHASVDEATAEAERLAHANPGTEFAVYQRVAGRIAEQHIEMKEVA